MKKLGLLISFCLMFAFAATAQQDPKKSKSQPAKGTPVSTKSTVKKKPVKAPRNAKLESKPKTMSRSQAK